MKINKLLIYLEKRKTKVFVGTLERVGNEYIFSYDDKYYFSENPLQLGPQLSFKKQRYVSLKLFNIFSDRIPSKQNAAYGEYCEQAGISLHENDKMILLAKLGSKGPSSFVIEREVKSEFCSKNLKEFRNKLSLSMRDFSELFDISLSAVQKIETDKMSGKEVLKRIEIYVKFPEVAKFEIIKNKSKVHSDVVSNTLKLVGETKS